MADTLVSLGLDDIEYKKGITRAMEGLRKLGTTADDVGKTGQKSGRDIGQGLMQAAYFADDLVDHEFPDEQMRDALTRLPQLDL